MARLAYIMCQRSKANSPMQKHPATPEQTTKLPPGRLAYQPPVSSTFLSEEISPSHQVTEQSVREGMTIIRRRRRPAFISLRLSLSRRARLTGFRDTEAVGLGKIPDTHYPYPNYRNPNPNYPNPRYPIPSSDSDCHYPKLVWVIRVLHSCTRTTRNLPLCLYLFTCC
jgi:hypothetical protein